MLSAKSLVLEDTQAAKSFRRDLCRRGKCMDQGLNLVVLLTWPGWMLTLFPQGQTAFCRSNIQIFYSMCAELLLMSAVMQKTENCQKCRFWLLTYITAVLLQLGSWRWEQHMMWTALLGVFLGSGCEPHSFRFLLPLLPSHLCTHVHLLASVSLCFILLTSGFLHEIFP